MDACITIFPKKIYHTTTRNNKFAKKYWEQAREGDPNMILPPEGEYHKSLDVSKYFTLHPKADYSSPWMYPNNIHELPEKEKPEVFLEYSLKEDTALRLLVLADKLARPSSYKNIGEYWKMIHRIIEENNYDGYISKEDFYEIFLTRPKQVITECIEIPFFSYNNDKDWDQIEIINEETEKMLGFKRFCYWYLSSEYSNVANHFKS